MVEVAYFPSRSSIQHTPRELLRHSPPRLTRTASSVAPEVDTRAEGLQVNPNGPYPVATTRLVDTKARVWLPWGTSMASEEKQVARGDEGLIFDEKRMGRKNWRDIFGRKRAIVWAAIAVVVIVCVVGGAVGGYLAHKKSSSSTPPSPPQITTSPQADLSEDALAVESGQTGMAHLPCISATILPSSAPQATPLNITTPYVSHTGLNFAFDITCRRGPAADERPMDNMRIFTTYRFADCMDRCSERKDCMGVVYGANLTAMVADGQPGGNCLLRNQTWTPVGRREKWFASAVRRVDM